MLGSSSAKGLRGRVTLHPAMQGFKKSGAKGTVRPWSTPCDVKVQTARQATACRACCAGGRWACQGGMKGRWLAHLPGDEMGEAPWASGTGAGTLAERAARAAELAARETLVKGLGVEVRPAAARGSQASESVRRQIVSGRRRTPQRCGVAEGAWSPACQCQEALHILGAVGPMPDQQHTMSSTARPYAAALCHTQRATQQPRGGGQEVGMPARSHTIADGKMDG